MGTWNVGIFDNDLSLDIKMEFNEQLEKGSSIEEATTYIMDAFQDEVEDSEDTSIVYITLAVLQLDAGDILDTIKLKVLEIIESGQDLEKWQQLKTDYNKRAAILNNLKEKLKG